MDFRVVTLMALEDLRENLAGYKKYRSLHNPRNVAISLETLGMSASAMLELLADLKRDNIVKLVRSLGEMRRKFPQVVEFQSWTIFEEAQELINTKWNAGV